MFIIGRVRVVTILNHLRETKLLESVLLHLLDMEIEAYFRHVHIHIYGENPLADRWREVGGNLFLMDNNYVFHIQ